MSSDTDAAVEFKFILMWKDKWYDKAAALDLLGIRLKSNSVDIEFLNQ